MRPEKSEHDGVPCLSLLMRQQSQDFLNIA